MVSLETGQLRGDLHGSVESFKGIHSLAMLRRWAQHRQKIASVLTSGAPSFDSRYQIE